MDRLAAKGVSLPNTFCPGATCIASRAAMFTGMYPHNTGVCSFDDWAHHRTWVQDLADAGYWCTNIGKMHMGPVRASGGFHARVVVEDPTKGYLPMPLPAGSGVTRATDRCFCRWVSRGPTNRETHCLDISSCTTIDPCRNLSCATVNSAKSRRNMKHTSVGSPIPWQIMNLASTCIRPMSTTSNGCGVTTMPR